MRAGLTLSDLLVAEVTRIEGHANKRTAQAEEALREAAAAAVGYLRLSGAGMAAAAAEGGGVGVAGGQEVNA
jgi:hypothetical protein